MTGTLHEDKYIFMNISGSFLLRMIRFRTKFVEISKSNFFFPEKYSFYGIMWKNIVERGRLQMTILRMRIACWILKAIDTHSYYVILIAFPRQKWLRQRASVLLYTYITYLLTYLLTPWSRVLLEKLTGSAASQEIPRIFGNRRFITVLTSARHLALSWANSIQSSQPPPTS